MNKLEKIKGLTGVLFLFVLAFLAGRFLAKAVDTRSTMAPAVLPAEGNWGLSFQEDGKPPVANATYEELAKYDAFYAENTQDKVLYLTFDCGYENGNTPAILDALKKHNVKATFFVVGNYLETSPDLVKRMLAEGHIVGNHSYHHPDMSRMDKDAFAKELGDLEALYEQTTGQPMMKFYRPPQGPYVDWDQDKQPTHEEAFDKLLKRVHPGAIVLLHNTSKTNGEILDELLTKWEGMGYSFHALTELPGVGNS